MLKRGVAKFMLQRGYKGRWREPDYKRNQIKVRYRKNENGQNAKESKIKNIEKSN